MFLPEPRSPKNNRKNNNRKRTPPSSPHQLAPAGTSCGPNHCLLKRSISFCRCLRTAGSSSITCSHILNAPGATVPGRGVCPMCPAARRLPGATQPPHTIPNICMLWHPAISEYANTPHIPVAGHLTQSLSYRVSVPALLQLRCRRYPPRHRLVAGVHPPSNSTPRLRIPERG